jgi:PIN domain nuclease of toxin-antitoxin system
VEGRSVIVLDTHVWLWWLGQPGKLSRAARAAIDDAETIGVSTLSAWEVTMLVLRKRISLDRDTGVWVRQAFARERVTALPPTADVAVAAGLLDGEHFPGDPFDRMIYATARAERASLVTRDKAIRGFDARTTVW